MKVYLDEDDWYMLSIPEGNEQEQDIVDMPEELYDEYNKCVDKLVQLHDKIEEIHEKRIEAVYKKPS